MITLKNREQLSSMRKAGEIVYGALQLLKKQAMPGISTNELDAIAEKYITGNNAEPSFKGYRGYPATICASIDDEVVHGIPGSKRIKEGQLLSIDIGACYKGMHADSALTLPIGNVSDEAANLLRVTEECFWIGAKSAVAGVRLSNISHAVQEHAESHGYACVRALCGHGIGENLHEEPEVPNFGKPGRGVRLHANMTIALEPMIVTGAYDVYISDNGWTVRTKDGGLCSHYEHTLVITDNGFEILTAPHEGLCHE